MTKTKHITKLTGTLMLAALLFTGCSSSEQEQQVVEQAISVKAVVVSTSDREIVSTYTGSLEGEHQAVLYSKLAEAVDSVWVREGDQVVADQVLLSLDRTGPSSSYRETESRYANAEKTYRKMERLFKEGAVSESDYDAAKTIFEVSQANFEAVSQLVEIRTPISGTVTSITVSPGDFVTIGKKLVTVATLNRVRVRFGVNSNEVQHIDVGDDIKISSEATDLPGYGRIETVASSADPLSRAFEAEALIDNTERLFSPGMFVRIHYVRNRLSSVVAIPRRSIVTIDRHETVFIVENGRAARRPVTLGADLSGDVVIESGINPGDTLVTLGQDYLDDGTLLTVTIISEQ
ncbi:MAG: hypothetical protein DRP45_05235 [Candidatus Zixiibacteriota bacterium]|nr:MAG: hypothetical protein DRP45_05235 [candidate division Zixibacteria bacterium]